MPRDGVTLTAKVEETAAFAVDPRLAGSEPQRQTPARSAPLLILETEPSPFNQEREFFGRMFVEALHIGESFNTEFGPGKREKHERHCTEKPQASTHFAPRPAALRLRACG